MIWSDLQTGARRRPPAPTTTPPPVPDTEPPSYLEAARQVSEAIFAGARTLNRTNNTIQEEEEDLPPYSREDPLGVGAANPQVGSGTTSGQSHAGQSLKNFKSNILRFHFTTFV